MLKQIIIWTLLVCPVLLMGQETLTIQQVGEFPGKEVLSVDGDRILVRLEEQVQGGNEIESSIVLYDISDFDSPEEVERFLPGTIYIGDQLHIHEICQRALMFDSLIIAVRTSYFHVYRGGYDIESADLVIFNDNQDTLWTIEIEFEQQEYNFETFELPRGIAVKDGFLYVGMGIGGIYIYDLTDPNDLEQVAHIDVICNILVLPIFAYIYQI